MGDSEYSSNRRYKEDDQGNTVIAPPQSRNVVDSGNGAAAAALNGITTGEGDGLGSSSRVSLRAKLQKIVHGGDEGDIHIHNNNNSNNLELQYVKPVINNANGSVMIPSDVVNKGSLPYSRTLYGFFIQEKNIAFSVVDYNISNMWKTHGIEHIMMNQNGFYFFKFKTDEGMLDALEKGPWIVNNIPIFLKRWTPGLVLDNKYSKLPVWINIYDMPLELWNKDGLNIVASMLGIPLAVDRVTTSMIMNNSVRDRAGCARVLVDVEATGNWVDQISVSVPYANGHSISTLRVEYSWKPGKCSFCKMVGHTDSNCIHPTDTAKDKANELNEIRLKKEEEEREEKRRHKAQPHLYTIIKVARDEDLLEQIGKDMYFDLVDHDKVRCFYIKKQLLFTLFKEEVAKAFGVPVQFQRFWLWAKRQNNTYRPHRPLTALEETQLVGELKEVSNTNDDAELKLFLEIEIGPDLHPLPPPWKSNDDILLFFKLYDPESEEFRYVGRFFVNSSGKPTDIISKLNERAGFSPNEEIELYEEIRSEPRVMCRRLGKKTSFRFSEIEDGDIICFQKLSQVRAVHKYRYPDVPSFLKYVKKGPELQSLKTLKVSFRHVFKKEPVIHHIRLHKQSTVGDILDQIKIKVGLSHPYAEHRLLQIRNHKIYKIFRLTEKIENINDQYWTLRAEEIPEEEKNMGPQDRLIHVYHFTKEAAQNQMQMRNFGEPFFLVIYENETLKTVKVRIQRKLKVPNEEFSKWKFAFVHLGCPEYLQDPDAVYSRFQGMGIFASSLGLEHLDTPS